MGDTGLAWALLGLGPEELWKDRIRFGAMLETFVLQELRREASWLPKRHAIFHFRDKDKVDVDFVIESAGKIAGVEVKAAATVTSSDFSGLRKLQNAIPGHFVRGILLYDGDAVVPFGQNLHAVPISMLWRA